MRGGQDLGQAKFIRSQQFASGGEQVSPFCRGIEGLRWEICGKTSDSRSLTDTGSAGSESEVRVPTHVAGTRDFGSSAWATVVTSWDMPRAGLPYVEVYDMQGRLSTPNPDLYNGMPSLRRGDLHRLSWSGVPVRGGDRRDMPMTYRGDAGRVIGLAGMADALCSRPACAPRNGVRLPLI